MQSAHERPLVFSPTATTPRGLAGSIVRTVRRFPTGVAGTAVIAVFIAIGILAPKLAPHRFDQPVGIPFVAPTMAYPLGTDYIGRDMLSRVLYGSRVSLEVGFFSVLIGTIGGGLLGLASGFLRGWFDLAVQRLIDLTMSLPGLLLALTLIAAFGAGLTNVILAIAVAIAPVAARIARASTLSAMERPFVDAARSLGADEWRVALVHVAPTAAPPVIVIGSVQLGFAVIAEAALSFLGLGVPVTTPSWGNMLSGSALTYMVRGPWMAVFPGLALMLVVLAFNLVGDAIRDLMDARYRRRAL